MIEGKIVGEQSAVDIKKPNVFMKPKNTRLLNQVLLVLNNYNEMNSAVEGLYIMTKVAEALVN